MVVVRLRDGGNACGNAGGGHALRVGAGGIETLAALQAVAVEKLREGKADPANVHFDLDGGDRIGEDNILDDLRPNAVIFALFAGDRPKSQPAGAPPLPPRAGLKADEPDGSHGKGDQFTDYRSLSKEVKALKDGLAWLRSEVVQVKVGEATVTSDVAALRVLRAATEELLSNDGKERAAQHRQADEQLRLAGKESEGRMEDRLAQAAAKQAALEQQVEARLKEAAKEAAASMAALEARVAGQVDARLGEGLSPEKAIPRMREMLAVAAPRAVGRECADARKSGVSAMQARVAGYTPHQMRAAGYSCTEVRKAGVMPRECKRAGYTFEEAQAAGVSGGAPAARKWRTAGTADAWANSLEANPVDWMWNECCE